MDAIDRVQIEVACGPLDESEVTKIRESVLIRDSDLQRLEDRVQASESKLNRIWYILTVIGFLAWAWIDGRFGLTTPNAVPINSVASTEDEYLEETILLTKTDPHPQNP